MKVLAPLRLSEAADSLIKASTPEPFSTSKTSNWVAKRGGLPPYVQHIAHDIQKDGKTESEAIRLAIGIVKNPPKDWDATAKAAAAKAAAEWEAKKGGTSKPSASKLRESVSLATEVCLRRAAAGRLEALEEALGEDGMVALLEAKGGGFKPELKRVASAQSEKERLEVHDGGQHVGTLSVRPSYRPADGDRWTARSVNGRRTGEETSTKEKALDLLQKHLEDAPGRLSPSPTAGRFLVSEPQGYSGPTTFKEYPSESAARYEAGLPEQKTRPEMDSEVAALGEMLRFDALTLQGFGTVPPAAAAAAALSEAGFERSFDEAKHPRGPGGKWIKSGMHVEYSHPNGQGRTFGRVESVSAGKVKIKSLNGPTHTVAESSVHGEHPGGLPGLDTPAQRDARKATKLARGYAAKFSADTQREGKPMEPTDENLTRILRNTARRARPEELPAIRDIFNKEFRSKGKVRESASEVLGSLLEAEAQNAAGFSSGDRVNYQHSTAGRVRARVTRVSSRHVYVESNDPRVSPKRFTHLEAKSKLSTTSAAKGGK